MNTGKKIYLIAVYPDENNCCMAIFPDFPELAPDYGSEGGSVHSPSGGFFFVPRLRESGRR